MSTIYDIIKSAQKDKAQLEILLNRFTPLIKKYSRKLFFLEREDAEQEIIIAIIEAVKRMKVYDSEGECISYINNAVLYKYYSLCKSSIKEQKIEVLEIDNAFLPYIENYEDVNTYIDLSISMENLSNKYKDIVILLLKGCSDSEIAEDLGVTRQYINRIKKNIKIL